MYDMLIWGRPFINEYTLTYIRWTVSRGHQGFDNAVLGPCLPDLQARVGASLDSMSFVFVLQGIGFLTGLLIGLLLDRNSSHRRFLIGVYVFLGSAANMSLPMVPHFAYLLSMFFLQGVTKGLVDFGKKIRVPSHIYEFINTGSQCTSTQRTI